MAIKTGNYLNSKDIYIDYPFEDVMFRRNHVVGTIYREFYGKEESLSPVPHNNPLYNEALLSGTEISREMYIHGKPTTNE